MKKNFMDGTRIEGQKPFVVVKGLLTKREVKTTKSGEKMVKFTMPINGRGNTIAYLTQQQAQKNADVTWAQIVFIDKANMPTATNIEKLTDGKDKVWVYLTGILDVTTREKDGKTYTDTTIYVRAFDIANTNNGASSAQNDGKASGDDEEFPFEM